MQSSTGLQWRAVDAVAGLLDGPRARKAFLLRSSMDPPWALRIEDAVPLTVVAIVRGSAGILPDDDHAVALGEGDEIGRASCRERV